MRFREVSMVQLMEILRLWLRGASYRAVERPTGIHRRRCAATCAPQTAGLDRRGGEDQLTDELLAAIAHAVRSGRRDGFGRGRTWALLWANRAFIEDKGPLLPIVAMGGGPAREAVKDAGLIGSHDARAGISYPYARFELGPGCHQGDGVLGRVCWTALCIRS